MGDRLHRRTRREATQEAPDQGAGTRGVHELALAKGANPTLLKTKINVKGPQAFRYRASDGTERGPLKDWRASEYTPSLTIRYLWQMSGHFGWVVEVTDFLVIEPEAVERHSPFRSA